MLLMGEFKEKSIFQHVFSLPKDMLINNNDSDFRAFGMDFTEMECIRHFACACHIIRISHYPYFIMNEKKITSHYLFDHSL